MLRLSPFHENILQNKTIFYRFSISDSIQIDDKSFNFRWFILEIEFLSIYSSSSKLSVKNLNWLNWICFDICFNMYLLSLLLLWNYNGYVLSIRVLTFFSTNISDTYVGYWINLIITWKRIWEEDKVVVSSI